MEQVHLRDTVCQTECTSGNKFGERLASLGQSARCNVITTMYHQRTPLIHATVYIVQDLHTVMGARCTAHGEVTSL